MSVFANGRSIVHKGDGQTNIAAPPDVCKTPSPGGPIPVPYPNIAQDSDLSDGTKTVKIEGNSVAIEGANLSTSSGDEAGTAGGLISSKNKGKLTWGSTSTDVVFEGKGVVRFMDVTQHNGNTFNTAFIAKGGTGLAYGDDTPCPICDKGLETHRIHEVSETQAMAGAVLLGLLEKFKAQRPIIAEHQRLKEARNRIEDEYKPKVDAIERLREPLNKRRGELIASIATDATAKAKLTEVQKQLAPLDAQSKALRTEREAKKQEVLVKMKAEHAKLTGSNVLRDDDASGTYTLGYMVGALVCKCPSNPKKLAACSGETTPGFRAVVGEVGFTLVQAFEQTPRQVAAVKAMKRKTWDCAGPKLIQKGGAEGHKIKSLSEQYFSPWGSVSVEVTYSHDGTRTTRTFSSGESVPSCATCQELVPEMLCDNSKPCA